MITNRPYNPATDDVFLYQDQVWNWTGGSGTIKTPYAWNPGSPLYGYRRSLEGMVAPLRAYSKWYYDSATPPPIPNAENVVNLANAVNPVSDPVNLPIWRNSFPPTSRMISKRLLVMCGHCLGLVGVDRQNVLNQTLDGLYQSGSYLQTVLTMRFIDGDDNVLEIPKSSFEYPYQTDYAAFPYTPTAHQRGVSFVHTPASDTAISVLLTQDFPFNPVTPVHAGSIPPKQKVFFLNAGNMTVNEVYIHGAGSIGAIYISQLSPASNRTGVGISSVLEGDSPFMHDSGSLFLYPVKAPTSVAAGDGIMGVIHGHMQYGFSYAINSIGFGSPPQHGYMLMQPAWTTPVESYLQEFKQYWINRGYPHPDVLKIDPGSEKIRVTKTQIDDLDTQVTSLLTHIE